MTHNLSNGWQKCGVPLTPLQTTTSAYPHDPSLISADTLPTIRAAVFNQNDRHQFFVKHIAIRLLHLIDNLSIKLMIRASPQPHLAGMKSSSIVSRHVFIGLPYLLISSWPLFQQLPCNYASFNPGKVPKLLTPFLSYDT